MFAQDVMVDNKTGTSGAIGSVALLAMMGANRSSALPNVPTFRELGVTDNFVDCSVWMAFLVPKATPDAVAARRSTEIQVIAWA